MDRLLSVCPWKSIRCSGMDVGLPTGQMGNSEVGHTNIGAGRVVYQELTRITKAIEDGSFFDNPELLAACATPNRLAAPPPDGPGIRWRCAQPHHPSVRPAGAVQAAAAGKSLCPLLFGWPRRAPQLWKELCGAAPGQAGCLADDKSQAVARKELLDQQIANTAAQIQNTEAQIAEYAA